MIKVNIIGEGDFVENFKKLRKKVGREIVYEAMVFAMLPVANRAKRLARRSMDTGNLIESIGLRSSPIARKGRLYAIVGPRRKFTKQNPDGKGTRTASKYGHLVEYGTAHSSAKPFMRPAWQIEKDLVFKRLSEGMGQSLAAWIQKNTRVKKAKK